LLRKATHNWHERVLFYDIPRGTLVVMASKQAKPRKPRRKKPRAGEYVNLEHPNWEPLLGLARIYVDEFMWMGEVELEHGVRLQSYKHWWTRRYIHLDGEGKAWTYREDGRYEPLVTDLVEHFNRVVRWHYAGQHEFDLEVAREQREQREAEEAKDGKPASELPWAVGVDEEDIPF
jgi:hypothetical protein